MDETVYIDYEDPNKMKACSAKFKTPDLKLWMDRHREYYKNERPEWEEKSTFHQVKFKLHNSKQITVKFYKSSQLVFAQSKNVLQWATHDTDAMKMLDSNHTFVKEIHENPGPSPDSKQNEKPVEKVHSLSKIPKLKGAGLNEKQGKKKDPNKMREKEDEEGVSKPELSNKDAAGIAQAIHRIEEVFVDTIKKAYDERDEVQRQSYLNEIKQLKDQIEKLVAENESLSRKLADEKAEHKEMLKSANNEKDQMKQSVGKNQAQYSKLKKDYDELLQKHRASQEKFLIDNERAEKAISAEKQEKEKIEKDNKCRREEIQRQMEDITKLRKDIEKLDNQAREHRMELSKAHDEIITLKNTIYAVSQETDEKNYTKVEQKSKVSDKTNNIRYFRGPEDPLSNMAYSHIPIIM